jgi:CNT family concentrative nucleoside transporter
MGVPVEHAMTVAGSLGTRLVVNEFVAYLQLGMGGGLGLDARSALILTYALCGFANLGSVGIDDLVFSQSGSAVPEPHTLALAALGLVGLASGRQRRRRA